MNQRKVSVVSGKGDHPNLIDKSRGVISLYCCAVSTQ